MAVALHEAGKEKAREISQDRQDSRAECMERVKEAAAKAMGRERRISQTWMSRS